MTTWRETNDRFQWMLDSLPYMTGTLTPFFYEPEEWALPVVAHYQQSQANTESLIIEAWREIWESLGRPDPVPSFRPDPAAFLNGLNGPSREKEEPA